MSEFWTTTSNFPSCFVSSEDLCEHELLRNKCHGFHFAPCFSHASKYAWKKQCLSTNGAVMCLLYRMGPCYNKCLFWHKLYTHLHYGASSFLSLAQVILIWIDCIFYDQVTLALVVILADMFITQLNLKRKTLSGILGPFPMSN